MYITFARSSSLNNLDYCEMQYFLTYNLGLYAPAGTKAAQGTAAHKVLECLAIAKKYLQENPGAKEIVINDESLGRLTYSTEDFFKEKVLSFKEINEINKSRINKQVYRYDCFLPENAKRMGVDVVEDLILRSSEHYSSKNAEPFDNLQRKQINNFSWIALDLFGGEYDPRKRNIFSPEQNFEIPIDAEWAYYAFTVKGEDVVGQFSIKGTIDLITQIDDDTLEIIDWKTGQRLNWATGQVKTYEDLCKDKQLMLYYYAARKLFPQFKNIIFTIFFVRDGGPYTLCFNEEDMEKMEASLKKHFEYVQMVNKPRLITENQTDFRCQKLCHYYKNNQPGTRQNICKFMQGEIAMHGIENVIDMHMADKFTIGNYNAPGE